MSQEIEDRLKLVGDYKHGSIRRIKLYNFLTYNDVEFSPGPRLNMVVGPNGTGKSTILCAICLGLGGTPQMLGRASDVETFVANGEKDGRIEIEIADDSGTNPVISRIIRREGTPKSTFQLNGHPSTAKKIQELVLKTYHISVNNLCTFLPQDKVGSFSGFDSKQLLIETEKSLSASQHLWHTHQALIEAQEELRSGTSNVDTLRERLEQLTAENQRLEREKQRMEERETALEHADLFRKKLHWLRFDEEREECKTIQENRKEVKQQCKDLKQELGPLQKTHTTLAEAKKELEIRYKALNLQTQKLQKEMEKQVKKYETHDDGIENALSELQAMDSHRARLESHVRENRDKVTQYEKHLADSAPKEQVEKEWAECRDERAALVPRYEEARREFRQKQGEHKEIHDNVKHAQVKWNKLQDDQTLRKDRIFRQEPKLRQVYDWIQDNRQLFRKEVIGPIVCEITSKSKNAAAFLEMHVPNATLKSFVVQSKEDYDLLYQNIRVRMKLPVNIINVTSLTQRPRMYSNAKFETLKREHGVAGYMDESFSAPDLVIEALKKSANIEKVLIGTDKTQESINDKKLLDFLGKPEDGSGKLQSCCIFSSEKDQSFRYTSTISRYAPFNAALKIDNVRPARWLAPGVSEEVKQKFSDDLQSWKEKEQEVLPAVQEAEAKVAEAQQQAQDATSRLGVAKENVSNVTKLHNKIKNAQRKLKEAEDALETDDEEGKQKFISVLKNRVAHSITALEAHAECHKQMMQATYKSAGVRINKDSADAQERHARQVVMEKEQLFNQHTTEYGRMSKLFETSRRVLEDLKAKADEAAPLQAEDGSDLPLKQLLDDLPVETREETEAALEEAEAKANSIIADPNVVRHYEERKKEIEKVQADLDDLTSAKEGKLTELEQKRKPWEDALTNSVDKVDLLFTKYMAELGCTGEVKLVKGEESEHADGMGSFRDWGIEIRVAFRNNTKPQVLSARVQSGGERSVSTIMYLMALQEMMVAPFRCVDEINQGLDDRNERLVFKRIVENSTKPPGPGGLTDHCGQYFLITPKLLPNLYDMEEEAMTLLFIFNGPFNFKNPKDWNVDRFLNLRQRTATENPVEEDEENSTPNAPNSQPDAIPRKRARVSQAASEEDL